MRPALEELHNRLLSYEYPQSIADKIIKEIEPFVGYGWFQPHIVVTLYAYPFNCWKLLKEIIFKKYLIEIEYFKVLCHSYYSL